MDCATYRRLYPKYTKFPLSVSVVNSGEFQEHAEHLHDCESCGDWTMVKRVLARGAKVEDYPCVHIAYRVTEKLESPLEDPFDDPDVVIWQFERSDEYGLPIRDGGPSMIVIQYCPWCGKRLDEMG